MIKIKESNFCYIKLNITLNKLIIISILLRVIVWISAASLPKWLRKLNFEKQQPMQTFNPKNLTFCTWRSIYLNIKEASWPIALRFGDSHLEHFQHFHVRLHEENYYPRGNMGFSTCYRVCWPVDVQMQKQNGGSAVTRSLLMLHLLDPG